MTAKWGNCALLVVCLAILAGCRTPQPNLKPEIPKEQLVSPPQDTRYETSTYPKQAFDTPTDPSKRMQDDMKNGVTPTRGGGGGMGGGSMGGGGSPGMR